MKDVAGASGYPTQSPRPQEYNPENPRRRTEKNFSDIFGVNYGDRQPIMQRQEATATQSCGWLDARSEIASRNKNPLSHGVPESAWDKKQKEISSHVFNDDSRPNRVPENREEAQ